MNLLLTGGAGFIGSHVLEHIISRPEIDRLINLDCLTYAGNVSNLEKVRSHPKYIFEKVDLRDRSAVVRVVNEHAITHVLHLAAESDVDQSIANPETFIQTNIVGTFNLLEACRTMWGSALSGKRFHHVSTDEVYGSLGTTECFTEETPYAPNSPYSASKASGDMLVRAYQRTYGFPAVISISSNNYGPRQYPEKLIPLVILRVLLRQPIPVYGDGLHVRDWLYVRDHAEALWQVLTRGRLGETYHVGARNEWTNIEIVEFICDLVDGLTPQAGGHSRQLIKFVQDRPGHDRRYAVDASKTQRELGWEPSHPFEQAIRETVQWYLNHREWLQGALLND
ncbi:MAG: dTDP-glucose 4,6-dehydratase [Verrucomicrobiota bacterium]